MFEFTIPTFAGDAAGDAAMVEAGKPVFQAAARLTGWPVEEIEEIHPNGMGPRTNTRVFRKGGQYMDVSL
jgi:hypothetical protein